MTNDNQQSLKTRSSWSFFSEMMSSITRSILILLFISTSAFALDNTEGLHAIEKADVWIPTNRHPPNEDGGDDWTGPPVNTHTRTDLFPSWCLFKHLDVNWHPNKGYTASVLSCTDHSGYTDDGKPVSGGAIQRFYFKLLNSRSVLLERTTLELFQDNGTLDRESDADSPQAAVEAVKEAFSRSGRE